MGEIGQKLGESWLYLGEDLPRMLKTAFMCCFLFLAFSVSGQWKQEVDDLNYDFFDVYLTDLDKAMDMADKAVRIARRHRYTKGLGSALYRKGIVFEIRMQGDSARLYLQQGIRELEKTDAYIELASAYNNLGIHYYMQFEYRKAIGVQLKAVRFYQKGGDLESQGGSYNNIGVCYKNLKEFDKAILYYEKAAEVALQCNDPEVIGSTKANIAAILTAQKKFSEADRMMEEAKPYFDENNVVEMINYYYQKGQILQGMRRLDEAMALYRKGMRLAKETGNTERTQYFYYALAELERERGNYKTALYYMQSYDTLRDSAYSISKSEFLAEYEQRFRLEEKEKEIARNELRILKQKAEKKRVDEQLASNLTMLAYAIGMIIVLAGLSLAGWWSYRLKRKSDALSKERLEEKNLLARELHHRVKNNLQIVASMISMQSRGMSDADRERMQSVIGSIQAMAGIHSHLYDGAAWEWVDARDLIHALAEQLPKEPEKPVVFAADVGGLIIDLDTAIAIGLMANELLTNSVKYAFPHTERPEISIALKQDGDALLFTYADNGPGLPDPENAGSGFGGRLLRAMAKKLKAEFRTFNLDGAQAEIRIFRFKLKTNAHTDR